MNKKHSIDSSHPRSSYFGGYTIIELLIVMALIGIVTAYAVPSLRDYQQKSRVTSSYNNILGGLNYTRSTAISLSEDIEICPRGTGLNCSGTERWESGFLSAPSQADYTKVGTDESDRITIRAYNIDGGELQSVTFDSQGIPNQSPITFVICATGQETTSARALIINNVGRTQRAYDQDGDGIPENAAGQPVTCPAVAVSGS